MGKYHRRRGGPVSLEPNLTCIPILREKYRAIGNEIRYLAGNLLITGVHDDPTARTSTVVCHARNVIYWSVRRASAQPEACVIVFVWGTRPEALKVGPVVAELKAPRAPVKTIATGQHWNLLAGTPAETDLRDALSLGLQAAGNPVRWVSQAIPTLKDALSSLAPSVVVVQGDTASAIAGAKAAHELGMPIAHIEAGIRSGNLEEPWPEEMFRREITTLASWHYTPTSTTYANLVSEGIPASRIRLTGNTVVSALARYTDAVARPPLNHIVLTMHRREWLNWVDMPVFLGEVAEACLNHPRLQVIWPVHPAVKARWPEEWTRPDNLWTESPYPYNQMMDLLSDATGLATDSGGLVEEAATFGIPTAILRKTNDRPEAVDAGIARQYSPTALREAIDWLAQGQPRHPSNTFGDPSAASQIAQELTRLLD